MSKGERDVLAVDLRSRDGRRAARAGATASESRIRHGYLAACS
jgi:hypothetical protein